MMYIATLQSLLCHNDLAALLQRQYGFDQHCRIQFYRAGMSDVYWVHTSKQPYVMKIYHHGDVPESIVMPSGFSMSAVYRCQG